MFPPILKQTSLTNIASGSLHLIHSEFSENQSDAMFDRDEVSAARAQALKDAAIAFAKIDINGDGTIDYEEAQQLIDQGLQTQDENEREKR